LTESPGLSSRQFHVLLVLVVALYLGHAWLLGYVSDDGYIALRYVQNFVHGHGFVYNPGERVEGYTSFAWVALLGILGRVMPGVDLFKLSVVAGVIAGAATVYLTGIATERLWPGRRWTGITAALIVTASTGFAGWATGGLETTLFALTVLVAVWAYLADLDAGRYTFGVGALLGLMAMTRPDGMVFAAAIGAHYLVHHWRRDRSRMLRRTALLVVGGALVFGPWFAWRWSWYGWPLPNTFYAKVGSGLAQYLRGLLYLRGYFWTAGAFLWFVPAVVLVATRRDERRDVVALLVATHLAYMVYVGGDGLRFFRFLAYTVPLFAMLAAHGFAALADVGHRQPRRPARAAAVALTVLAVLWSSFDGVGTVLLPGRFAWYEPHSQLHFPFTANGQRYDWFENYFVVRQELAARWLDAHTTGQATMAATPAGAIAYFSRLDVIDMLGLNDTHIGHMPVANMGGGRAGHEKGDGAYVLSRRPAYILLGNVAVLPFPINDDTTMAKKLVRRSEHEIWDTPAFHRDYERVVVQLADDGPFAWFTFYRRRDLAAAVMTSPTGTR
jgi:hypothetical protein